MITKPTPSNIKEIANEILRAKPNHIQKSLNTLYDKIKEVLDTKIDNVSNEVNAIKDDMTGVAITVKEVSDNSEVFNVMCKDMAGDISKIKKQITTLENKKSEITQKDIDKISKKTDELYAKVELLTNEEIFEYDGAEIKEAIQVLKEELDTFKGSLKLITSSEVIDDINKLEGVINVTSIKGLLDVVKDLYDKSGNNVKVSGSILEILNNGSNVQQGATRLNFTGGTVTYENGTVTIPLGSPAPTYTTGSVLFAGADGIPTQDNTNLFYDNTNNYLGIGTNIPTAALEVKGTAATDRPTLSADLVGNVGWSGVNATGDNITGWTFGGGAASLKNSFAFTVGSVYEISVNVTVAASRSFNVTFGDNSTTSLPLSLSATGLKVIGWRAESSAPLFFQATGGSAGGLMTVVVKEILQPSNPVANIKNSSGAPTLEIRANSSSNNLLFGNNSGQYMTTAAGANTGIGANTLQYQVNGSANIAIAGSSLSNLAQGVSNIALSSFSTLRVGDTNVGIRATLFQGTSNVMINGNTTRAEQSIIVGATINNAVVRNALILTRQTFSQIAPNTTSELASALVPGVTYTILTKGTTDFTAVGALNNLAGTQFTATGAATGTGTAQRSQAVIERTLFLGVATTVMNNLSLKDSTFIASSPIASVNQGVGFEFALAFGGAMQTPRGSFLASAAVRVGGKYRILTIGTTDFTLVGASANILGVEFTATGVPTGTGTVANMAMSGVAIGASSQKNIGCILGSSSVSVGNKSLEQDAYSLDSVAVGDGANDWHSRVIGGVSIGARTNGYTAGAIGKAAVVATALKVGAQYEIAVLGTTDFTLVGAATNTVGVRFIATGAGLGTGTAFEVPTGSIAIGTDSLRNVNVSRYNVSIGDSSQINSTTGLFNTSLGGLTLPNLTTGDTNTVVGYNSGRGITTGVNNTIIGANVAGLAAGLANNIILADGAGVIRMQTTNLGHTTFDGLVMTRTYTVATLPVATLGVGFRAFVTDSLAPVWGMAVAGGGAVPVPVYSDGTVWRVG